MACYDIENSNLSIAYLSHVMFSVTHNNFPMNLRSNLLMTIICLMVEPPAVNSLELLQSISINLQSLQEKVSTQRKTATTHLWLISFLLQHKFHQHVFVSNQRKKQENFFRHKEIQSSFLETTACAKCFESVVDEKKGGKRRRRKVFVDNKMSLSFGKGLLESFGTAN